MEIGEHAGAEEPGRARERQPGRRCHCELSLVVLALVAQCIGLVNGVLVLLPR